MTVIKKPLSGGSVKYVKYSEAKAGDVIATGVFQGTQLVKAYDPSQPNVPQHTVLNEDGVALKLNSSGQLNYMLKDVPVGTNIEVVFLGKEKIKLKTGRTVDANQFEVFVLEESA